MFSVTRCSVGFFLACVLVKFLEISQKFKGTNVAAPVAVVVVFCEVLSKVPVLGYYSDCNRLAHSP